MGADLLEPADERLDVGVGELAGEVLFDRVPVVAAGMLHVARPSSVRTTRMSGGRPRGGRADEADLFHSVDDGDPGAVVALSAACGRNR
jgi:hypothetical protein